MPRGKIDKVKISRLILGGNLIGGVAHSRDLKYVSGYYYDNISCLDTAETIEYMKGVDKPWMAFKVLAAGAIHPREGFKYAFDSGVDFIHVGMFDFQICEDVIIAKKALPGEVETGVDIGR